MAFDQRRFEEREQTWTHGDEDPQDTGELQIGLAEKPLKAQDCIVSMDKQGVFGIFDGMGGHGTENAGRVASNLAAQVCWNTYDNDSGLGLDVDVEIDRMRNFLHGADTIIQIKGEIGTTGEMGTTAVLTRLVEDNGELHAVWASVGDSRLYIYRDKEVVQISQDEGEGHYITNALGTGRARVDQLNSLLLKPGDRLMLCSDGITGDYEPDILKAEDIEEALSALTPQAAANRLLEISRKHDDKSVIVVDVNGIGQEHQSSALQEHRLEDDEVFTFDTETPLELRGSYNVLAQIAVADKELLLLDLRPAPAKGDKRVPFGESVGLWNTDFLLVDESFFGKWGRPIRGQGGYKGLGAGEKIYFGRNNQTEKRFELLTHVSRNHFTLAYDGVDLALINHQPTNGTIVTVKH